MLSEHQKKEFTERGYFIISNGFSHTDIEEMRLRLDNIIEGDFKKNNRRFQIDSDSGRYEDLIYPSDTGYRGANVPYRKISDLEYDDLFLQKLQSGWIREVCSELVDDVVSIMRVTMMDKPPDRK